MPSRVFNIQVEKGFKCDLASSAIIYFNLISCKYEELARKLVTLERELERSEES